MGRAVNRGLLLVTELLKELGDISREVADPKTFAARIRIAHTVLLEEAKAHLFKNSIYRFDRYVELRDELELLLAKADEIIAFNQVPGGNVNACPYRNALTHFIKMLLEGVMDLIDPSQSRMI
jgi:hypothetical protein